MPALLTAAPFDLDAAGLRLVAEVEAYLAQLPAPANTAGAAGPLHLTCHQPPRPPRGTAACCSRGTTGSTCRHRLCSIGSTVAGPSPR